MADDLGSTIKKNGRPKIYVDSAARQKAYRVRMKEAGFREIKNMVRDVRDLNKPLASDIIDLSEYLRRATVKTTIKSYALLAPEALCWQAISVPSDDSEARFDNDDSDKHTCSIE